MNNVSKVFLIFSFLSMSYIMAMEHTDNQADTTVKHDPIFPLEMKDHIIRIYTIIVVSKLFIDKF